MEWDSFNDLLYRDIVYSQASGKTEACGGSDRERMPPAHVGGCAAAFVRTGSEWTLTCSRTDLLLLNARKAFRS